MVATSVSNKTSSSSTPPQNKPRTRSALSAGKQPSTFKRFAEKAKVDAINVYRKSGVANLPLIGTAVLAAPSLVRPGLASKALSWATKNPMSTVALGAAAIAGSVLLNELQSKSKGSSILMQQNADGTPTNAGADGAGSKDSEIPQKTHQQLTDEYNAGIGREAARQRRLKSKSMDRNLDQPL